MPASDSRTPAVSRAQWPERGTSGGCWASALGKGRAQCLCLFLHPPRLEPCMRLSPHTAQHRLDTSSPVTVPRHPAGAFPRVRMRVPGLLGEPTGCGPSPCAPAFPGSNYYAHTATPSGLGVSPRVSPSLRPARLPSRWELPMCTILDSCDVRSRSEEHTSELQSR